MKKQRIAAYGYTIMSIAFYVAGIAYLLLIDVASLTWCKLSGVALIIYGMIKIIGFLSDDLYDLAFQYDLGCGLFLIALGIIALIRNQRFIDNLSAILGALILLDSFLKMQTIYDALKFGITTWKRMFVISLITAVFAMTVILKPFASETVSRMVISCALFAEGLMNQCIVHDTLNKRMST